MTHSVRRSYSVVIRAYNEQEHIGRLLTGLRRQSEPPNQVVVVDSGSDDATVSVAQELGAEVVHISPEHFTFGRSLNHGIEHAHHEFVLIASAHVYPCFTSWASRLMDAFGPSTALAYGRQVGDSRTKFAEKELLRRWFPESSDLDQQHAFCNNANAMIRRKIWEDNRYDESLTGLEDLAWAKQAMAAGSRVAYVGDATVVHVHEESWSQVRNRYRREAMAHKRIYQGHGLSAVEALGLSTKHTFADWRRAASEGSLRRHLLEIPLFHASHFLGAWEGFRATDAADEKLMRKFYYPQDRADKRTPEHAEWIDYSQEST